MTKFKKVFFTILAFACGMIFAFGLKTIVDPSSSAPQSKLGLTAETPVTGSNSLPASGQAIPDNSGALPASASLEEKVKTQDQTIAQLRKDLAAKTAEIASRTESEKLPPVDDTPEERERLANEMLDLTNSKDQIEMAFAQVSKSLLKDADPAAQEALQKVMSKYYSWDVLGKTFVKIYSDVFSVEDLQKINRFYTSEPGQMLLEKQPELMQKTMNAITEINQKNLPAVSQEMQKILKKDKTSEPAQAGR